MDRWQAIEQARKALKLPKQVTRSQIRDAYRQRCRELHPDLNQGRDTSHDMNLVNASYTLLMDYADEYTIQLEPNEFGMTDEEWWMHKFGQDPVWHTTETDQ